MKEAQLLYSKKKIQQRYIDKNFEMNGINDTNKPTHKETKKNNKFLLAVNEQTNNQTNEEIQLHCSG